MTRLPAPIRRSPRRSEIPAAPGQIRRASGTGAVLGAILDHGPVARSTVARLTGLSPASVTGHVGQLLSRGLVRESAETTGPRGLGRPHVPLEVDTSRFLVAGTHIAVHHSTVALMDLRGRIVAEDRRPHRDTDPRSILAARLPPLTAAHAGGRQVLALGFATGHRVDPAAGVVVDHPHLGWSAVPVREILSAATGLPVHVDSHSRALARAEQMFGEVSTRRSTVLHWYDSGAADGFNIMPAVLPSGLEVFVDRVVPILQERGLFRTEYTGSTLRERYGLPRPVNRLFDTVDTSAGHTGIGLATAAAG